MTLRTSTGHKNKLMGIRTNLVTDNPSFDSNTTGWTAAASSTLSVGGSPYAGAGCLQINTASSGSVVAAAYKDVTTVIGRTYRLEVWFKKGTSAGGKVKIGTTSDPVAYVSSPLLTDAAWTKYVFSFVATGTTTRITLENTDTTNGNFTAFFDEVNIYHVVNGYQDIYKGCFISFYDGTQPASADTGAAGHELVRFTVGGVAGAGLSWNDAASGIIGKNSAETWQGSGIYGPSGAVATWFRVWESDDDPTQTSTVKARWDGTIATSGAELNMSNAQIDYGSVQILTGLNFICN